MKLKFKVSNPPLLSDGRTDCSNASFHQGRLIRSPQIRYEFVKKVRKRLHTYKKEVRKQPSQQE